MANNRRTQTFPQWMLSIKELGMDEYSFELNYPFDEAEFWEYYEQGMEAEDAINTHLEKTSV